FLLSWLIFFIYLWGFQRAPVLASVIWMPYLLLVQFMLVTAVCLFVSCLNVFYEDVKYIVTIFMGLGLFVLPIMYVIEQPFFKPGSWLHGPLFEFYARNPLTALITGYRKVLLQPPSEAAMYNHKAFPLDVPGLLLAG